MRSTADKFWDNTRPNPKTGCLEWLGSINQWGYAVYTFEKDGRRTSTTAHRYAYQLIYGSRNRATVIRHTCDNPRCVNPKHLEEGTQVDNMRDMRERGREIKGKAKPMKPIAWEPRWEAFRTGLDPKAVADKFGVGLRTAMRWRQLYYSTERTE